MRRVAAVSHEGAAREANGFLARVAVIQS
jgi:hypothetical protein